jgi:hypothetical protein
VKLGVQYWWHAQTLGSICWLITQTPIRLQVGAKEDISEEERGQKEPGFRTVFELRSSNAVMPTTCTPDQPPLTGLVFTETADTAGTAGPSMTVNSRRTGQHGDR